MSEQDGTQPSAKRRSRRQTNKRNSTPISALQHPATDDKVRWQEHWEAQGQPWRTEPEVAPERQKYLAERRNITPDIEKGIYPFKGIKLCRADVEWLLAAHEGGGRRGPVEWSDESQREREGIGFAWCRFAWRGFEQAASGTYGWRSWYDRQSVGSYPPPKRGSGASEWG